MSMEAKERLAREQAAYLRGYVKALTDSGYWAPETFAGRFEDMRMRLENAEKLVASFESEVDPDDV